MTETPISPPWIRPKWGSPQPTLPWAEAHGDVIHGTDPRSLSEPRARESSQHESSGPGGARVPPLRIPPSHVSSTLRFCTACGRARAPSPLLSSDRFPLLPSPHLPLGDSLHVISSPASRETHGHPCCPLSLPHSCSVGAHLFPSFHGWIPPVSALSGPMLRTQAVPRHRWAWWLPASF